MKTLILSAIAALSIAGSVSAQTAFTYQGQLKQAGQPFTGTADMNFNLFDSATGPGSIGDETHNGVQVTNGTFTVDIGGSGAGWDLNLAGDLWLEITVNGTVMTPRQKLMPTPHALTSDTLKLPFDSTSNNFSSVPTFKVQTQGTGGAIWGESSNTGANGVNGYNVATSGAASGVRGVSNSPSGYGVVGVNQSTSNQAVGGYFETTSKSGLALWGRVNGGGAHTGSYAGNFENTATTGLAIGVQGYCTSNNNGFGVRGWHAASGGFGAGVLGHSDSPAGYGGYFEHGSSNGVALYVQGKAQVKVLQILGGSDLAEGFDVNGEVRPGMVVSIDPCDTGKLAASTQAYDKRVAGVVSGAGGVNVGMVMGQAGSVADGKHPVALSGRVYCWAVGGADGVEPGDLLTTSAVAGHAMKATDGDAAHGATIGKAMSSLKPGETGLVLVLVNLQ